ncbi:MAG TPA: endo alpha-1,4 polygalactosaminidase [Saprospiraceae bacterium]|nr:endo alpha-1,4 polygalactosaminidase [Saprospiraceae bacterium]
MFKLHLLLIIASLSVLSCENEAVTPDRIWYRPTPQTTFDWDLRGPVPNGTTYQSEIVDIDAFENEADFVASLHTQGKKVFAYISVGSLEDWRPDADDFPSEIIGNDYPGWSGEKFLNIHNIEALKPLMRARFDMIQAKGFDGIEPDNIDLNSWTIAELGFEITDEDVINYAQWLAEEAHQRGLLIGQKNATDLADDLVSSFDWILLEDAFYYGFQNEASIYIQHNKAVFATEYTDEMNSTTFQTSVCPLASSLQFTAILKNRDLDAFIETCN